MKFPVDQKGSTKESRKRCDVRDQKEWWHVYPRVPQQHVGYTREGGAWWMVEGSPAMKEEACVGWWRLWVCGRSNL